MKPLAIDTNVLIDMFAQGRDAFKEFRQYDKILLSATVLGEYKAGITDTRAGRESRDKLEFFLSRNTVETVPVTERTAELYAKVFQALKERGKKIPQNDVWIAASALEHGADLATSDEHFLSVPMLTAIVMPRKS
jgi:tRNA(fMet)-specific endonuclease VapC